MLDKLFKFVKETCMEFRIDESHGLTHSIQVYRYGVEIYFQVLKTNPEIENLLDVIICACVLHDMCDYKYMDVSIGIKRIVELLEGLCLCQTQIDLIVQIVSSMSYTKIKAQGFPKFNNLLDKLAFNIVREADLLAAYDFDRSVVYAMECKGATWTQANKETVDYFKSRVLTQISDGLFTISAALNIALQLDNLARAKLNLTQVNL